MATYWPSGYWSSGYWLAGYWPGGTGITPVSPVSTGGSGTTAAGMGAGIYVILLKNLDGEIVAIFSGGGHGVLRPGG